MPLSYTWETLTAALLKRPYMPGLIGRLGLFTPRPQPSTIANIEIAQDRLALVPAIPRGAPPTPNVVDRRSTFDFRVPHFPIRDTIFADAVQDLRGFGVADLENFPAALTQRIDSLSFKLDCTQEHLRLGAVRGRIITAVDRSTGVPIPGAEINLFEHFEVPSQPIRDWPIVGAGEAGEESAWLGQLTRLVNSLGRDMADELPGGMLVSIFAACGKDFFDSVSAHPERRAAFIGFRADETTAAIRGGAFQFRDITFAEYRGRVGATAFVVDNEAHFFAVGIPDLFVEVYAPADYTDTVNTLGLARYLRQEEMDFRKGVELEGQMNCLPLCTIPRSLFTARATQYTPAALAGHAAIEGPHRRRA